MAIEVAEYETNIATRSCSVAGCVWSHNDYRAATWRHIERNPDNDVSNTRRDTRVIRTTNKCG